MDREIFHQIAPALLDGYKMPSSKWDRNPPIYLPAMNHIWMPCDLTEDEMRTPLLHESIHVFATTLQSLQLLHLKAILFGRDEIRWSTIFREIVETTCDVYYWLEMSLLTHTDVLAYVKHSQCPELYEEYVKLAIDIANRASKDLSRATALRGSVMTLGLLSLELIPKRPQSGLFIIRALREISATADWKGKLELYLDLDFQLREKFRLSELLQDLFFLSMPMGAHTSVLGTVFYLAQAIKIAENYPYKITAVFPLLLELITQSSFILVPVLTLARTGTKFTAQIKMIHTTSRSQRCPDRSASLQLKVDKKVKQSGKYCGVTPVYVSLIKASRQFRLSSSPDRTVKCFETLLSMLPELLSHIIVQEPDCPACLAAFGRHEIKNACKTIMEMSLGQKKALVYAAENFREFLDVDVMELMEKNWGLDEIPYPKHLYQFL
jgi:hypothetical protein